MRIVECKDFGYDRLIDWLLIDNNKDDICRIQSITFHFLFQSRFIRGGDEEQFADRSSPLFAPRGGRAAPHGAQRRAASQMHRQYYRYTPRSQ